MDGTRARCLGGFNDCLAVQIRIREANRLIGVGNERSVRIGFYVNRHSADSHGPGTPNHTPSNFATVGHQKS